MSQTSDTERLETSHHALGLEDLPDAAVRCAGDGTIEAMNPKAASLLGCHAERAVGLGFAELALPAADRMAFAVRFQTAAAGGPSEWNGHRLLRQGGSFWGETSLAPSPGTTGTVIFIRDASRAKFKDQMAMVQSAITAILAQSPDLDSAIPRLLAAACQHPPWDVGSYWAMSATDGMLRCEHQYSKSPGTMAGFRERSFALEIRPGQGLPGRVLASAAPEWMDDIRDKGAFIRAKEAEAAGLHTGFAFPVLAEGKVSGLFEFFTSESSPVDAEFMAVTESMAGQVSLFIGLKKAEQDLAVKSAESARSRDQLAVILQGAADGVAAWSPEGLLIYCNEAYARFLGKDSAEGLAGLPMQEVRDALDARDLEGAPISASELPTAVALRGATVRSPMRVRLPRTGEERWVIVHSAPVFGEGGEVKMAIIVLHDRTEQIKAEAERKASEDRRHQSQKMEAMGRLAGGIAHDFNNLLTAINGYSDLLANILPPESQEEGFAREIRNAGERAAALTQQLLAYSRKQVLQKKVFAFDDTLRDMDSLLRRLIGENIVINVVPGSDDYRVEMDPGQLEQIILNLAINARDAMPKGGTLRLESAHFRATADGLPGLPELRPGEYIRLGISDSGTGMDQDTLSHMFEPFFTTKEQGKGTGLGLSTVFGIVNQAEGHIKVDSEPGRGSRFDVYIPALPRGNLASGKPPEAVRPKIVGSEETLLLVEDEPMVRDFISLVLKAAGFKVLEASNGLEALVLQRSHPGPIQMLLSDVVMPAMGGEDLADALRLERPGIRVLFVSGYAAHGGITERLGTDTAFLKKPFTGGALLGTVRELLAAPAA